jgi:multidrug efflux system membrane fusion protein
MTDQFRKPSASSSVPAGAKAPAAGQQQPSRRWLLWLLVVGVALVLVYALVVRPLIRSAGPARARSGFGAVPVSAEPARKADLSVRIVALGTVTPIYTVTVHSRVDGELQKIYFQEGTNVEAGAPLADLDPRPFEVQKQQAEAQLAKDNALLDEGRLDLVRYQTLLAQDSVAKQQVDSQDALVRQYEATIKLDQAQVASAALQLAYSHITSPITGRIGLRNVDQGNIVHAADASGIAVITQLHPITVLFAIPQDAVPKVMTRFKTGEPMTVEAYDRGGKTLLATGRLVTIDNQVDPSTGTVKLRAEFPNTDETLFPNQFVNVQLIADQLQGATVVLTAAIQRSTTATYVYLVVDNKTASVRPVETGPSEHGLIVVSKGLVPGDVVVVDGVDKLREGSAVELVSRNAGAAGAPAGAPAGGPDKASGKRGTAGAQPARN